MPIFEYKCWNCGAVFQEAQQETEPKERNECPRCGSNDTTCIPSSFAELGQGCSELGDYGSFT